MSLNLFHAKYYSFNKNFSSENVCDGHIHLFYKTLMIYEHISTMGTNLITLYLVVCTLQRQAMVQKRNYNFETDETLADIPIS